VFDLADVLLEFGGVASVSRLSHGCIGAAEFSRLWQSNVADRLYRGLCTPNEFAAAAVAELGLPVGPEAFLEEFRAWLRGPYPGAFELLAEVRRRVVVACLSNTNALDVARFRDALALGQRFDHCFFSNEIGLRKPDRDCYEHVLARLDLFEEPGRVVFFDDSLSCVQGAQAVGMMAYQTSSVGGIRSHLVALGVLPAASPAPGA
jgi:putative hydrolase of the HAD superfamily